MSEISTGEMIMDKRAQKSRSSIINTFLEIRSKKPLEKITVTELCKKADLNKSTFYVHYHDIYDLSEQLETEVIDSILESICPPETILTDPGRYTAELFHACRAKNNLIRNLFSGTRSMMLPYRVSIALRKLLYEMHPEFEHDPERNILLTYQIYGGYFAYSEAQQYDYSHTISVISEISRLTASKV